MSLSPNHGPRRNGARPELVVIHFTAMQTAEAAQARLCDPAAEVSAHWLISETGQTTQLVDEDRRAWHAGAGEWGGRDDVNSRSIGIELANDGRSPFPEPQMTALERLLKAILTRWGIPPAGVIGHSDMAPGRKMDPGPRFDWRRLALQGLSVWPVPAPAGDFAADLHAFGFPDHPHLLEVFRLRFRPWADGPLDETDRALAAGLDAAAGRA
ncbi:N-acetylmuramoyl-L-alanine amidase [Falsirhodobacter deserti]|uniref:N-acetylmuramoyl-L-alanine amidase n=1 Tax=Falsirhodobacter deserti TaxID=1365611 RepID=UPI000FE3FCE3|nr:N-acetylmuramoyl-L-alanine amidase [Falsirhodobacter deserti]